MARNYVSASRKSGISPLHLLDEAYVLLRRHPDTLGIYLLGAIPFSLALLYYWSDMSRSAFARERCALEALLVAVAFVWMKACQSRFMTVLLGRISGDAAPRWGWHRWIRVAVRQTLLQSTGLFVLPLAMLITLPYAWCHAFYQNVLVFGNGEPVSLWTTIRLSWQQACRHPRQNHGVLGVLGLFSLFVFLELLVGLLVLPRLLSVFLGVETVFSRSGWYVLNSTLLAVLVVLSVLVVDPLFKCTYALRCFYGLSVATAADLRVVLRRLVAEHANAFASRRGLLRVIPLILLLGISPTRPAMAGDVNVGSMDPRELKQAIRRKAD